MTIFQALKSIIPLGFTAGINLYLTLLVVGLSIRFGWVEDYPAGLEILAGNVILIAASILYVIEFVIDKIPFLDSIWDLIHTIIRPLGAILIATSALTNVVDTEILETTATFVGVNPRVQLISAIMMATVALLTHSSKAGTRVAINATGSNITCLGVILSFGEDLLVAIIAFLALRYPTVANVVAWGLIIILIIVVPQLIRWAWFTFKLMIGRIRGLIVPRREMEPLPEKQAQLIQHRILASAHCQAQGPRPLKSRYGYLVITSEHVIFLYKRWFRPRRWEIARTQLEQLELRRGVLMLALRLTYSDAQGNSNAIHFAFSFDRKPLAENIAQLLDPATQGLLQATQQPTP